MAQKQEIAKSAAVTALAFLHFAGVQFVLMPSGTVIVTLVIIQAVSLLNSSVASPIAKKVSVDSLSRDAAWASMCSTRLAVEEVLFDHAWVRYAAFTLVGGLLARALRAAGACGSLMQVCALALAVGGLAKYLATLSQRGCGCQVPQACRGPSCPYSTEFWPAYEAVSSDESKDANLEYDVWADGLLQLPSLEDES